MGIITNFVFAGTSPNNLVIEWTPMPPIEHNGQDFQYQIKYRRQNVLGKTPSWSVMQIMDWRKRSLMVPNQETYVPYDIMVIAFNKEGQSKGKTVVHTGRMRPAAVRRCTVFMFDRWTDRLTVITRVVSDR